MSVEPIPNAGTETKTVRWEADIAFKNPFMRRQLFLGITISFGILWLILEVISWFGRSGSSFTVAVVKRIIAGKIPTEAWFALGFVLLIIVCTAILTRILMPTGYRAAFQIDEAGASVGPAASQKSMEKKLAWALILGGAARKNPGAVGQGLLLGAQSGERIAWDEVEEVELHADSLTIILKGKWRPAVALVCTPENYENTVAWVRYYRKV